MIHCETDVSFKKWTHITPLIWQIIPKEVFIMKRQKESKIEYVCIRYTVNIQSNP